MPRTRGMLGPGSARMGGGGAKPGVPHTPMAGAAAPKPPGAPPVGGLGAPPTPRPRMAGPPPGLAGPAPGGAPPGGMAASGGFARGGKVGRDVMEGREEHPKPSGRRPGGGEGMKFAKGGIVGGADSKKRVGRDTGSASKGD